MCNSFAEDFVLQRENAEEGIIYKIIQPYRGGPACLVGENGFLSAEGLITCAAYIKEPMHVLITGVPLLMRISLGVCDEFLAVFRPGSESFEDVLQTDNDQVIHLSKLAHSKVRLRVLGTFRASVPKNQANKLYLVVDTSKFLADQPIIRAVKRD